LRVRRSAHQKMPRVEPLATQTASRVTHSPSPGGCAVWSAVSVRCVASTTPAHPCTSASMKLSRVALCSVLWCGLCSMIPEGGPWWRTAGNVRSGGPPTA
jgi:hypothetical protein